MDARLAGLLIGTPNIRRIESWRAEEADGIAYGLPVFGYRGRGRDAYRFHLDRGKIVFDADFVASNSIVLTIQGVALDPVVYAVSHDNTMDLLVAAVEAAGYEAALDSGDVNNRTLFITTIGQTAVVAEAVTGGGSQPDGTITYDSDPDLVFIGVSVFDQKEYNEASVYAQNEPMSVLAEGLITVEAGETIEENTVAYIRTADGLFGTSGFLTDSRFRSSRTGAGLVDLEVRGQNIDLT
jgi:hypothetical protein